MKWEKTDSGYRIVYKGYECKIVPWGSAQWIGKIASHQVDGYSYQTAPFNSVEGACKRCLEVVDAR
jgi:hypothetical protein